MDQYPHTDLARYLSVQTRTRSMRVTPQGMPTHDGLVHYLGRSYSLRKPQEWPADLAEIQHARPDVGRACYGAQLLGAIDSGRLDLMAEHAYWRYAGGQFFTRYITSNIDLGSVNATPDAHWLWRKPFRDLHPTVNYYSARDILAVRLAWLWVRPSIVVPESKNLRKLDKCPDDDVYRRCVNPNHYEIVWEALDPAPNWRGTRQGLPDDRTPKSHRWEDLDGTLVCYDCGNPLSRGVQDRHARGEHLERYQHCPNCYSRRQDESGRLGRQLRGTSKVREQTRLDLEAEGWLASHRPFGNRSQTEVIEHSQALPEPEPGPTRPRVFTAEELAEHAARLAESEDNYRRYGI
jgi:hypothetical protein